MKLLLSTLAAVFGAILAMQWIGWDDQPPLASKVDATGSSVAVAPAALSNATDLLTPPLPLDEYVSITERPLFLPDRRPVPSGELTTPADAQEPEPVDDSVLQGLDFNAVLISGDSKIAWIRLPREPKPKRMSLGDEIEGWTLAGIQSNSLLFRNQEAERRFQLRDYGSAPPRIPPTPFAPPSPGQPQKTTSRPPGATPPPKPDLGSNAGLNPSEAAPQESSVPKKARRMMGGR